MLTVDLLLKIFDTFYNVDFNEFKAHMFQDFHLSYQEEMYGLFTMNPLLFVHRLDRENLAVLVGWINTR